MSADTLLRAVILTFDPVIMSSDLWPWTFLSYCLWRDETLYQIWAKSTNPRPSYLPFEYL